MLDTLFFRHPRSVGERYGEHARFAAGFGFAMIRGGLACLVHAAVPGLCTNTGSSTIRRLHARITSRQPVAPQADTQAGWQLFYEI